MVRRIAVETIEKLRPDVYVKGSEYADPARDLTGMILEEERMTRAVGGTIVFTNEETFSSSSLINRYFSSLPAPAHEFLRSRCYFAYNPIIACREKSPLKTLTPIPLRPVRIWRDSGMLRSCAAAQNGS